MNKANSPAIVIEGEAAAALLEPLTDLVIRAGAAILAVNRTAMRVEGKLDGSPVTEADLAADRIIAEGLARIAPQVPAVSEERVNLAEPSYNGSFFLIDPLDGTKEYVAGRDEFTVNLALVTNGTPLLGIVGAPALGLVWRGTGRPRRGTAAVRRKAGGRADPYTPHPEARRALDRRRQPLAWRCRTEAFIEARPGAVRKVLGSAVKFGRVAEGASRYLSAPCADIGMGYRGRPRRRHRRRRHDHGCAGRPVRFGSGRDGFHRAGIHRLGRSVGGGMTQTPARRSTVVYSRQILLQGRPARIRFAQDARGIGGEGVAGLVAAEQIKPLSRNQPEPGVAGHRDAAGQIDRVVAAELGTVNFRMGDKGRPIAFIAEAPDRARGRRLEVLQAEFGLRVDEIGDGVIPLDGQAGDSGSPPPARWWRTGPPSQEGPAPQRRKGRPARRSRLFRGESLFEAEGRFFPAVVPS